jgi:thiamine-monophosphate kinase
VKKAPLTEDGFLAKVLPQLALDASVVTGPGDDCAVVRLPGAKEDLLFTVDPIVEGHHFDASATPAQIGRKAVARATSDIAAMGGRPRWILLSLLVPRGFDAGKLEKIFDSAAKTAEGFGAAVVGGDTGEGENLTLSVTVVGTVARGKALLRSGAKDGDLLFTTGKLGGNWKHGAKRHLSPHPRLDEGAFLAEKGFATAAMDLSDGLLTDLRRMMAASGTAAVVFPEALPRKRGATEEDAMAEGEDYELLFTVPSGHAGKLLATWPKDFAPLACIGAVVSTGTPPVETLPGPTRPGDLYLSRQSKIVPAPHPLPHHFAEPEGPQQT